MNKSGFVSARLVEPTELKPSFYGYDECAMCTVAIPPTYRYCNRCVCPDCGRVFDVGDWPFPCHGKGHRPGPFFTGDSQIHTSEKVTVMHNPQTGETRIPGRGDRPLHPKYAAAGFEYRKLDTHQQLRKLEAEKGIVHESSSFDSPGNQLAPKLS